MEQPMPKADPSHTASRRTLLASLPVAAAAISAASSSDARLLALCQHHVVNKRAFNECPLDADESPFWPPYEASSEAISKARPMTLAGLAAKARAAKAEASRLDGRESPPDGHALEWAWDLVNDLVRLDGGMA
jgi:hypothetical protein